MSVDRQGGPEKEEEGGSSERAGRDEREIGPLAVGCWPPGILLED